MTMFDFLVWMFILVIGVPGVCFLLLFAWEMLP